MSNNNFQATSVNPAGLTNLIRNLGRDCMPSQFIREFTKNAMEACQRTGLKDSKIVIDLNETIYNKFNLYKISFTDNGDGMSETQMINLLNNLSASGNKNEHINYGVGAKISALTRNHAGIQYESWKDGVGHTVLIKYNDEQDIYGIQGTETGDGRTLYALPTPDEYKPEIIKNHGTRVTLWGMVEDQDTMLPPEGIIGGKDSWIALYLNTRFFQIPENIDLKARIAYYRESNKHSYLANLRGQKNVLDSKSLKRGTLRVSDATIYWWIMPKGADGHAREYVKGHTALINQNEIFDISDSRSNRAAYFGVIFGRDQVIIYVEPDVAEQNTARTNLIKADGSPVSWTKWQDEFRENMPTELKEFLDSLMNENSSKSHTDSIRDRLKNIKELFRLSRYKPSSSGSYFADPKSETPSDTGHFRSGDTPNAPTPHPRKGRGPGAIAELLLSELVENETDGIKVNPVEPDPFPKVQWQSASENESLIDRAAEYIPNQNLIIANKDFQGLNDLISYFSKNYSDSPELTQIIRDEVMGAFEQLLTESVAGALALKNRTHWNSTEYDAALSKEALTTVVMQRYWMISHIKRVLGNKIKGFNDLMAAQE